MKSYASGSVRVVGLALGLMLCACGGEQAGGGTGKDGGSAASALGSDDPAVAGPAVLAAWKDALAKRDGKALIARIGRKLFEDGKREMEGRVAELRAQPEMAAAMQKRLKLDRSPVDLPLEDLLAAQVRMQLEERGDEEFRKNVGVEFVDARREGALLVLTARPPPELASQVPAGVAETVYGREGGVWVLDHVATERRISRWVRSLPVPAGGFSHGLEVTPDGSRVVLYGSQGVLLLPLEGGGAPVHLPVSEPLQVLVHPRGEWVATSSSWGAAARPLGTPPPAESETVAEDAAPTPTPYRGVVLWSLEGKVLKTLPIETSDWASLSPDGGRILFEGRADHGPAVMLFDIAAAAQTVVISGLDPARVAFLDDARCLVQGDHDMRVHALDGKRLLTVPHEGSLGLAVHGASQRAAALLRQDDGSGGDERAVAVYDLASGEELTRLPSRWVDALRFSPDGRQVACGSNGIKRFDAATGALRREHKVPDGGLTDGVFAFHPTGRWLVALGDLPREKSGTNPVEGATREIHLFRADE
jgi:hypothetical protein